MNGARRKRSMMCPFIGVKIKAILTKLTKIKHGDTISRKRNMQEKSEIADWVLFIMSTKSNERYTVNSP